MRRGFIRNKPMLVLMALLTLGLAVAARSFLPGPREPDSGVVTAASDLSKFKLVDGYRIELVASEPMIDTPVAMTFDGDGRLWVVEMGSYMPNFDAVGERVPTDRIVILEDTDGDGVMDKSTVFLDRLILPRAVLPCYGGALVLEPPGLFFCRDADGDGRADSKTEVLTGFAGRDNPEHAGNGLIYGIDNWVYLSQHPVRLRFDGERVITQPTPAHGQWGIAQDDAGRLFYTPNSEALQGDAYPKHYAARNPNLGNAAGINIAVCKDQTVWPSHPTPAVNRGYQPGTLRADGTLANHTAACGPVIYRAALFGAEYYGNAFICEAAANLVKRIVVKDVNGAPTGTPAYRDRDFLTSTDDRFRPVNTCVGPDGALYIADMYRGVIQHKTFITDYLREQSRMRRLERPLGLGRIYRVVPEKGRGKVGAPKLSQAATAELVAMISHPDAWWREAAEKEIVERRAVDAAPGLREVVASGGSLPGRLVTLWTLDGLSAATIDDALMAMRDGAALMRCAGLRISERWASDERVRREVRRLIDDPDRMVRVQAALSAGEDASGNELLWEATRRHGDDSYIRSAVASGLRGREWVFLDRLLADRGWPSNQAQKDFLGTLAECTLRAGDAQPKAALVERIGAMSASGDARAGLLMTALAKHQRLDSQGPRVVSLSEEPRAFLAIGKSEAALAKQVTESAWYLTWPGRPRVDPPKKLRALTESELSQFGRGQFLFTDCIGCHGADGKGLPGTAPPLAGSARVQGPVTRLARILLHGFEGEIEREGVIYNGVMAPAPRSNDGDLAALMTYIRRAWGNVGDPVTEEQVSQVRLLTSRRRTPWHADELERIK